MFYIADLKKIVSIFSSLRKSYYCAPCRCVTEQVTLASVYIYARTIQSYLPVGFLFVRFVNIQLKREKGHT